MQYNLVPLTCEHLDEWCIPLEMQRAYFSTGSVAYCLLADNVPVFAGGIVNMLWQRGEAWLLPTQFFNDHLKTCYKHMAYMLPRMASIGKFRRVQATCAVAMSTLLFQHLGFEYEGVMKCFGPNGETCYMYARVFE